MIIDWYLVKHSVEQGKGYTEIRKDRGFRDKDKQHCIIIDIVTNTGVIINHVTLKEVTSDH